MENKIVEKNIITAVFKGEDFLDKFIEKTTPEHFTDSECRKARVWIGKRYMNSETISIVKLALQTDIDTDSIVFDRDLFFEFDDWLDTLHKNYVRRKIVKASKDVYSITQDTTLKTDDYMHKAQDIIFQATSEIASDRSEFTLGEALYSAYDTMMKQQEAGETKGVKTGMPGIDFKTGGLTKGHLIVIAGQTSMGKTSLALSITRKMLKGDKKISFISLEMSAEELADRLVVMEGCVSALDYNNRKMNDQQKEAVDNARGRLSNHDENLIISEKRGLSTEDIKAIVRKHHSKQDGLDLIVVDYLQRIALPGKNTVNKEVGTVANQLRDLAGELETPLVLISQLNRGVQGKPKLKHLRDSGEIEEAADSVWFVYRPSYDEEIKDNLITPREKGEIILAKGRTSGTGLVNMYFYPEITRWRDGVIEDKRGEGQLGIFRRVTNGRIR